jgi:transposase
MAEETTPGVEARVREIRRRTRKKYSAEEKVRIVLGGLRGESTVAELGRREGIDAKMYYKWSKEFLEAGKQRLVGDTQREADSQEVEEMRSEYEQLKAVVAELSLKNRVLTPALAGGARETLKYQPTYPRRFGSLPDARSWAHVFFPWYNFEHHHYGLGLMTPAAVHLGEAAQLWQNRQAVLQQAYAIHPQRFVNGLPKPPTYAFCRMD